MKTMDEFKQKYSPQSYAKEQEEKEIEEKGIGKFLADRFINAVRSELTKITNQ